MKKIKDEKIIYGVYYRKSSEDDDRQVRSMDDQKRDLDAVIVREKLIVAIEYPKESQSAFSPGRSIFGTAIKDVEAGRINALLVWHANRLSRNPVDSGWLIHLMDIGKLKEVKTPSRIYRNTASDKFQLQLDFSMSKKDSDDKSEVVIRALEGRALRGLPHGMAKVGYLNDFTEEKGNRSWKMDEVRFPLIEKIFKRMLTGQYSVAQIYRYATELGITTSPRKREGGKPIAFSYLYLLLRDPIYAGFFYQNEVRYELEPRLKRAITEEEYWKIQAMLGSRGRPKATKHEGLYNPFLYCGQCNGHLSSDFKFQLICSNCKHKFACTNTDTCPKCDTKIARMDNPTYLSYVYYYCLNKKKHRTNCTASTLEQGKIDTAVSTKLMNEVCISKELSDWCIKNLGVIKDAEIQTEMAVQASLSEQDGRIRKALDNLLRYRVSRTDITPEQEEIFNAQEKGLQEEWSSIKQRKEQKVDWYSEAVGQFTLMGSMEDTLQNGTSAEKKQLLHECRSNLTLKDKNLIVTNRKSLEAFSEFLVRAKAETPSFEPKNIVDTTRRNAIFSTVIPTLLPRQGSNLRPID